MGYLNENGLARYDGLIKSWVTFKSGTVDGIDPLLNWQKTSTAGAVTFYPLPAAPIDPVVNFAFTETAPANGEPKAPDNPSTIAGVSSVKVTRCGKNLLKFLNYSSSTINGVTCSADSNGIITLDGTASGNASFQQYFNPKIRLDNDTTVFCSYEVVSGTYTLPVGQQVAFLVQDIATKTGSSSVYLGVANNNVEGLQRNIPAGYAIAGSNVVAYSGSSFDNLKLKVQIEFGSIKTLWESPVFSDYTIPLGGTYYGGSVDLSTGVMTVTWVGIALDGTESWVNYRALNNNSSLYRGQIGVLHDRKGLYGASYCTHFSVTPGLGNESFQNPCVYTTHDTGAGSFVIITDKSTATSLNEWLAEQKAAGHPVVCVWETNPYTVQLTPTQIYSLSQSNPYTPRINTVYSDQTSVQVGYPKSPIYSAQEITNAILELNSI